MSKIGAALLIAGCTVGCALIGLFVAAIGQFAHERGPTFTALGIGAVMGLAFGIAAVVLLRAIYNFFQRRKENKKSD